MTPQAAKKDAIMRMTQILLPAGYTWTNVRAKMMDFSDLARDAKPFVYVYGLAPGAMDLFDAIRADHSKGYVLVSR